MPGFLQRLFAPRWRHNDPRVRLEATEQLSVERDREKLESLLHDDATEVRTAALTRLATPELYLHLLERDHTDTLYQMALDTLTGRQRSPLTLDQRQDVIRALPHPELLAHVAHQADNQQLRLAALARINQEALLVEQACQNSIASVRQAAAMRIDSDEGLEQLAREAKRDKQIMRSARDRLNQRRDQRREYDTRQQRRDDLIQAMTRLSRQSWEPMLPARYRHLVREWQALAEEASDAQRQQFDHVEQLTQTRVVEHDNAEREARAREQAMALARRDSQRIIDSLAQALADLEQRQMIDGQDMAQLHAHFRLQAEQWRDLTDRVAPRQEDQQRFEKLMQKGSEVTSAWQRFEEHRPDLESAIDARDFNAIRTLKKAIAWPESTPCPSLLMHLPEPEPQEKAEAPTRPPIDQEAFDQDMDRLEAHLDRGELQDATRLLDSLMQRRQRLPNGAHAGPASRLQQLNQRTRELRDWRSFAAAPKREQLIEAMEALPDAALDDLARDQQHRRLVRDWKALGDAAASRERSTRFRTASDQVREQLAGFYRLRDQQREENLAERQRLCEQLETLLNNAAAPDPDGLRTIRDRAREEWRRWSPVPRSQEGELRQRFSRALRALQTLIDQQARAIAEAKQALVEQVREIETEDIDDERRAEKTKALQARWRELGRAPRGEEQALWRVFRQHCDAIFERRNAQRTRQRQHRDNRLDDMQALIDRMDQWQPQGIHDQATLEEAEQQVEALMPLPNSPRTSGMLRRWQGIVRDRRRQLDRLSMETLIERWQQWQPLLDAHVQADEQALSGETFEPVDAPQRLTPEALDAHRLRNERRTTGHQDKAQEWLEHLRVHLTVLTDEPLDEQDSSRRLDVQVARLNSAMGNTPSLMAEIDQLQCRLLASGPIDRASWQLLAPRIDALMNKLRDIEADD